MHLLDKPVSVSRRGGSIEWRKDHYRVRISLSNGTRASIALRPGTSEAEARAKAAEMSERASRIGNAQGAKKERGT